MKPFSKDVRTKLLNGLMVFSILLFFLSGVLHYTRSKNIFGIDLRNRIVGARLLHKIDHLYQYKFSPTVPEKYKDPMDVQRTISNRITVPPSFLLFLKPFSEFSYKNIVHIWFYFQYGCLLLITTMFVLITKNQKKKWIIIVGFLVIGCSNPWIAHLYVAQNYIIYPLLLTLVYIAYTYKNKMGIYIAGLLMALLIFIRPPFLLLLLPFLIYKKKDFILSTSVGLVLCFFFYWTSGNMQDWQEYYTAMKAFSTFQISPEPITEVLSPALIEGVSFNKDIIDLNEHASSNHNLSFQRLFYLFLKIKFNSTILNSILILFVTIFLILYKRSNKSSSDHGLFILGFLFVMLSEYLIAAPRLSYNYVQWIFPLCIAVKEIDWRSISIKIRFLIVAGLFLNLEIGNNFVFKTSAGELMLFLAFSLILLYDNLLSQDFRSDTSIDSF